ncbi:homeobox-leucine zipper protein HAT22-like [Punica granatum]|uniref:Homeobox-leucine zipper protein HAT22-like n=1 Tax=Punica granatum TaxID=22663 RepID=A0A6P8CJZ8_PUNGR|nr:homeobox-leucine zipper protein HAT22-like [Punica granatum]
MDGTLNGNSKRRDKSYMMSLGLSFSGCSEEDEEHQEEEKEDRMAVDRAKATAVKTNKVRRSNSIGNGHDGNNIDGCRKKLRLTKEQSALLEESFKLHSTLAPAQKQALADQLNLKPRQVEVWFQNRRARSKLKQIELDFERLKKKCDSLSDRNQRLEKELHDLKSMKDDRSSSSTVQLPSLSPASFLLCSSCQKIIGAGERN